MDTYMAGIEKWAALSDSEKAVYRKVVQQQAKFDQNLKKFIRWAAKNPRTSTALAGAGVGGAYGAFSGGLQNLHDRTDIGKVLQERSLRKVEEQDSPIREYSVKNPFKTWSMAGTGLGALVGAGTTHAILKGKNPLLGALGGALAGSAGLIGADKYLAHKRKTPEKPTRAPVNTPSMPETA